MQSVLISIQPPNTCNIFDGFKDIEWRSRPLPMGKYYCYETKNGGGIGKVIGEFHIAHIKRFDDNSDIPEALIKLGCVSRKFLYKYCKGGPLYANFIIQRKKYDKPRELSEFYTKCDEGCPDCGFWKSVRVNADEFDMECSSNVYGYRPLRRPPQSWCYVESEVDTE